MIKLINIWEEKRYERMKYVGHNLVFKKWMISVESLKALEVQSKNVLHGIGSFLISPVLILLEFLTLIYMILPKIFIKK